MWFFFHFPSQTILELPIYPFTNLGEIFQSNFGTSNPPSYSNQRHLKAHSDSHQALFLLDSYGESLATCVYTKKDGCRRVVPRECLRRVSSAAWRFYHNWRPLEVLTKKKMKIWFPWMESWNLWLFLLLKEWEPSLHSKSSYLQFFLLKQKVGELGCVPNCKKLEKLLESYAFWK